MKKNIFFFQGTVFRDFGVFFNVRIDKSIDLNMTLLNRQSFSKRKTDLLAKLPKTLALFIIAFAETENCY
jgi:hypothetical protein